MPDQSLIDTTEEEEALEQLGEEELPPEEEIELPPESELEMLLNGAGIKPNYTIYYQKTKGK